ncbi:hypothetical protein BDR07DRAFT_1362679 [Suillus spraguei]|nr:hypothetical protein BDR07DRAFT_1362679 [Suillus spraguei]
MASATQPQSKVPEITVLNRVASIPLITSSLEQINAILEKSMLTRFPYHTAQAFINTAYNYSEPIQIRHVKECVNFLMPLIVCADDIANKVLDAVESRYTYPFQPNPEEVESYVRETAGKTFENVKSPAVGIAERIDKAIAENLSNESPLSPESSNSQYQYRRAINFSKDLEQVQRQSVLVESAMDTANTIATMASNKIIKSKNAFYSATEYLISEMLKIQRLTCELPQNLQTTYPNVSQTIANLQGIIRNPSLPAWQKLPLVCGEVKERASPLLEEFTQRISEISSFLEEEEAKNIAETNENNDSAPPTPQ